MNSNNTCGGPHKWSNWRKGDIGGVWIRSCTNKGCRCMDSCQSWNKPKEAKGGKL